MSSDRYFFSCVGITLACHAANFAFFSKGAEVSLYGLLINLGMIAALSGYLLVSGYCQMKKSSTYAKPQTKGKL